MNKFLISCSIFFYIFLLVGCKTSGDGNLIPIDKDIDSIQKVGILNALISYGPTSYFIYKGTPMGFEYELLKKYAKSIDVELVVTPIRNRDSIYVDLNNGLGDVVASNFAITQERLQYVNFTHSIITTQQVLVQRKPSNWKQLNKKKLKNFLLKSSLDLSGKTVVVTDNSAFHSNLKRLSADMEGDINIKTVNGEVALDQLIEKVANGKIDYTVMDKNMALVNQWKYPNIDANMVISVDQEIGWMTRKNSDSLILSMNSWLLKFKKTRKFKLLYRKYFNNQHSFNKRLKHRLYTLESGQISPYDTLFKRYAKKIYWDWELLTAMVYQESHFNNRARGWGGSFGLMQFMPETGAKYGVDTLSGVEDNIGAGVKYLKRLDKIWEKHVVDSLERIQFVLASYNVGPGHVIDAKNLAEKYGKNSHSWKDVSYFLLRKSEAKYYKDEVVKHGYCKGYIVYDYVNEIMERYNHYRQATQK